MSTVIHVHDLPQPAAPANTHRTVCWALIAVLILVPALAIVGNQGGVLRIAFPLLSVIVSGFLYLRSKPMYVGAVLWLWFLTPFVGRLAEYQGGGSLSDPVLVAPYLAAGISVLAMLTSPRKLGERRALPFVCALVAILYGGIIGLPQYPLFDVLRAVLNWVVPVVFGFFLLQHREHYSEFRSVIEKSFLFGILVSGLYGIWQFFNLPDWDKTWMLNVQMNSFGKPEAMAVRVFSTMNAPAIFAAVAAVGVLLLFNMKGKLRLLSAAVGFIALILTMSRASWLSLVAGFIYLATKVERRQILRLGLASFACVVFLLAFAQLPVVHDLVMQRIDTFSDPTQDVSYTARVQGHERALRQLMQEPFGEGIGSTDAAHNTEGDDDMIGPHDSTVLEFIYSLGWIGSFIYCVGIVALCLEVRGSGKDPFILSAKAIVVGLFAQCLLNSIMLGILGFMVWTFAALAILEKESTTELREMGPTAVEERTEYLAA